MQIIDLVPDLRPTILAAREMRDARNTLARFLPYQNVAAISYRLGRRKRADQVVPIRAFDAPAVPIRRPGVLDVRGDLPAITPIVDFTETDLNQEMVLAQQLAGLQVDWQPAITAGAAQAALTIDNTLEVMRGQVLSTGVVSLVAADGATHSVDFGVPSDNKITVTAAWSDDPTAIFADLEAAHEVYLDSAGGASGAVLTSGKVKRLMLKGLQELFPQQPVGETNLSAYLTERGLPTVLTNDRTLRNYDGTKQRVFPEGSLTFLPSADDPVGRTEMGVTQEAVQQVQRVQPNGAAALQAGEVPGLTIVTLGQDNPVQRAVKGAAVGLPVLQDNEDIVILSGLLG